MGQSRAFESSSLPNTIFNSKAGQQIFQNINTRLIGKIESNAVSSFESILRYDYDLINRCSEFKPKPHGLYTQWLFDDKGTITFCRYYVPTVGLALVANNTDEQEVRELFLKHYSDKYEAISHFALVLADSIQSGKNLRKLAEAYLLPVAA
jgi:hypothetical protein